MLGQTLNNPLVFTIKQFKMRLNHGENFGKYGFLWQKRQNLSETAFDSQGGPCINKCVVQEDVSRTRVTLY